MLCNLARTFFKRHADNPRGSNIKRKSAGAWVLSASHFACLMHYISRWAGLRVMNALSVMKVLLLIVIIILGFAYWAGAKFGHESNHRITAKSNFDYHSSFAHPERDLASIASSLSLILQTFSGFQQPFYASDCLSKLLNIELTIYKYRFLARFIARKIILPCRQPRQGAW